MSHVNDAPSTGEPEGTAPDSGAESLEAPVEAEAAPRDAPLSEMTAFARYFEVEQEKVELAYSEYSRNPAYPEHLVSAFASYSKSHVFTPGQLVQWKPLLKNKSFPHYGRPAVIVRMLDEPVVKKPERGILAEELDIVIGYLDGEQDFVVAHAASRRFTIWAN